MTPESVPVGLMATMLKQTSNLNRRSQVAFFPYKPLDPHSTPQVLPNLHGLSDRMRERINAFLEDERREEQEEKMRQERSIPIYF